MTGRLWLFGDDVDTDALAPGRYMHRPLDELAAHCLADRDPRFAAEAATGDVILAGRNFGVGSSREQAAQALKHRGLAGVVARSFAGIFYRNAINLGLPVLIVAGGAAKIPDADTASDAVAAGAPAAGAPVRLDVDGAALHYPGGVLRLQPIPDFLLALLRDGGLVPHLEKRFRDQSR